MPSSDSVATATENAVYGAFLEKVLGGGATGDVKAAWDAFLGYLQDVLAAEEKK